MVNGTTTIDPAVAAITPTTLTSSGIDPNLNLQEITQSLMQEGGGVGLSFDELVGGGLSPLQAQTRLSGFTGQFGEGRASAFRQQNPESFIQSVAQTQNVPIDQFVSGQIRAPGLPQGAQFQPVTQQVQTGESLEGTPLGAAPTIAAPQLAQAPQIRQALAQAGVIDEDEITALLGVVPQIQARLTGGAEQAIAQQGTVDPLATITGQLENLLGGTNPILSRITAGAKRQVLDILGARGLESSSIAGEAITEAIFRQAIPIAAQDAQTFFQSSLQNLSNRQQTSLENTRLRQQTLLTDVSIENAVEQFNASNQIQRQQFVGSLVTNIKDQNANRVTGISQFNSAQANEISAANVNNQIGIDRAQKQMELAVREYNSQLTNQRDTFNANMSFAVEQANVTWRRNINTQNTVSQNAAMQSNVQNRYNLSATALSNIWQQFRDESYWTFQAGQSQANRDYNNTQAANNRQFNSRDDTNWVSALGSFASNLFF